MAIVQEPLINVTTYQVIYGDTDQMGVVYYANYLRLFEKGRSEFLRQIGSPYAEIEAQGFHFPVVEVSCRYFKPAHYDDIVIIATQLTSVGRAKLNFDYKIAREVNPSPLALGSTKHACVDTRGRIVRIPAKLAQLLGSVLTTSTASKES